jgi:hypothetical protein
VDNNPISLKNQMLGMVLAWIIPLSLGGILLLCGNDPLHLSFPWEGIFFTLALFLFYGGLTQLVYIIPLILFFRQRNNRGLVRGLWIGAITVFLANILGMFWFHHLVDKAHQGTAKGNISKVQPGTPVYYGDAKKVEIVHNIKTALPAGSMVQNVIAYLDANKFEHDEYNSQSHSLSAIVRNVKRSPVMIADLKIFFMFDKNGKLIDFTHKEVYTGL